MNADEKAASLYRFDGADPSVVIALRSAFRAGAEWRATVDEEGSCWDEGPILRRRGECTPYGPRCELRHGHGGAHRSGTTEWIHYPARRDQTEGKS